MEIKLIKVISKSLSKDYTKISHKILKNKIILERRNKKSKSINKQNIEQYSNKNKKRYKERCNKEQIDKNELTDDTSQLSTPEKNNNFNDESNPKLSSHSSKNLIKIDNIKNPIEDETKNKSDDEYEKFDQKLNNNKNCDTLNEKEEEINKKDNINFNNNIKSIFNNIGTIKNEKENGKDKNEKKDKKKDKKKEKDDLILGIYNKGETNIRKLYYSQLLLKKVWKPINDSKRHNNLIIFDWDDTLLPTSFLAPRGIFEDKNELTEKEQSKINKLENSVKKLLELALSKSDVYIITNAGEGWVQFSAEKYYPSINDILKKIEVISARERFEKKYPEQSNKWKIEAFLYLKKRLNDDLITNIICVGDSVFEMEAGRILASNFIHAVIKTIKFREKPKPEELNKQLNLVLNQFNSIFSSSKNLTVRVEKKKPKDDS